MSLVLTGGVALAYAAGVVGVHRWAVYRRRRFAGGYPTLAWRDWDALLEGVLPAPKGAAGPGARPVEGGPAPALLSRAPEPERARQHDLVSALVAGHAVDGAAFEPAGFSGGEARWLSSLSRLRRAPDEVLATLEAAAPVTAAEAYLREALALELRVTPLNLELSAFGAKRRIGQALARFGEHPSLFFVRARASSLLGWNGAVLDDLARAVYFSRERPFYLEAVLGLAFVDDARPALARACRQGLARRAEPG